MVETVSWIQLVLTHNVLQSIARLLCLPLSIESVSSAFVGCSANTSSGCRNLLISSLTRPTSSLFQHFLHSSRARSRVTEALLPTMRLAHITHPSMAPSLSTSPPSTHMFRLSGSPRISGTIGRGFASPPASMG